MKKFDGMLICTDLDGTLLCSDFTISQENIDAIEYFKSEGGYFTFITGRMPSYVKYICDAINPNCPFGCINGGGLYDHTSQKYIWTHGLPNSVIELVKYAEENLPEIGIQINTFDTVYFCKESKAMARFREITGVPNTVCNYNDIKEPIAKVLFGDIESENILKLQRLLMTHPMSKDFTFYHSEKTLYEIVPKEIHKGFSIQKLCEILNLDINKTIAIGDYHNDIDMLRTAKIGVAVSNAAPEIKAIADYITVSNDEHAIAAIISDLDSGKLKI